MYLAVLRVVSESLGLERIAVEKIVDEVNREKTNRLDSVGTPRDPRLTSRLPFLFAPPPSSLVPPI